MMRTLSAAARVLLVALLSLVGACRHEPEPAASSQLYQAQQVFEHKETRDLVTLVNDAADVLTAGIGISLEELRARLSQ